MWAHLRTARPAISTSKRHPAKRAECNVHGNMLRTAHNLLIRGCAHLHTYIGTFAPTCNVHDASQFRQLARIAQLLHPASFRLRCCTGTVAGFAADSWIFGDTVTTYCSMYCLQQSCAHLPLIASHVRRRYHRAKDASSRASRESRTSASSGGSASSRDVFAGGPRQSCSTCVRACSS